MNKCSGIALASALIAIVSCTSSEEFPNQVGEWEVLESVVQGKTTKSIAAGLGSSYHTVRNQRSSILKKLKVNSVVDAVRMVSEYRSFECFQNIFGAMGD